jgi:hypothetical protein
MPGHTRLMSSSFSDERAVGLQQGQQEIERARAELDWNAVGEQLSSAQQNAKTAEFESLAGVCPVRGVSALPKWVSASEKALDEYAASWPPAMRLSEAGLQGRLSDDRQCGLASPLPQELRSKACEVL